MGAKFPNPRRIKIHRNYSIEQIARVLAVHKNTVRRWQARGLEPIDRQRPYLFLGTSVRSFLTEKRARVRQPCLPGQLYCLRCRAPREPAQRIAEMLPVNGRSGNLRGVCEQCGGRMYRRVTLAKLHLVRGGLVISFAEDLPSIGGNMSACLNGDLETAR